MLKPSSVLALSLIFGSTFFALVPMIQEVHAANSFAPFTTPYPVYAFGSWGSASGGVGLTGGAASDAQVQQMYLATDSAIYPWGGVGAGNIAGANWCSNANTTTTTIPHSGASTIYGPQISKDIVRYQTPYFITLPLDVYGMCKTWVSKVTTQYPDLITYNSSGKSQTGYLRVDDINFAKQLYKDMVNLKNNFNIVNSGLLTYWYGIGETCSGCDKADYPKAAGVPKNFMMGNNSVNNFSFWSGCTNNGTNATYGTCTYLRNAARGTATSTSSHACCKTSTIYTLLSTLHPEYGYFVESEYFLGQTYAAYNITQTYLGGRSFGVQTAFNPNTWITAVGTNYPFPYNKTAIKNLDLLQKYILRGTTGDEVLNNGSPPSTMTINNDKTKCKAIHTQNTAGNIGNVLVSDNFGYGGTTTGFNVLLENAMYLTAYCMGYSLVELGQGVNDYSPTATLPGTAGWNTLSGFATILARLKNVGANLTTTTVTGASSASTGVSMLGGKGFPTLAWFFTNRTSSDTASVTLSASTYHLAGTQCVAISMLDLSVLGLCSAGSISITATIPARGWNPVFVMNSTSNDFQTLYSTVKQISASGGVYKFAAPHGLSSWLIAYRTSTPISVVSNMTGTIPQETTLSGENSTLIGETYSGGIWTNNTAGGWCYDSTNKFLYVHYYGDPGVQITVTGVGSSAVTQLIIVNLLENGAPTGTWTISGCAANPTHGTTGSVVNVAMRANCPYTVNLQVSGRQRWGFISGTTFSLDSASQTSCSLGTCKQITLSADMQEDLMVSGCPGASYSVSSETNDGWYKYGDSTTVACSGVYSRNGGSGTRITSWQVDGGSQTAVSTTGIVITSTITMKSSHTVNFALVAQYQLTTATVPSNCGFVNVKTSPTLAGDSGWYDKGTSVQVQAVPSGSSTFSSWSGSGLGSYTGTNNPTFVQMLSPVGMTANFGCGSGRGGSGD